MTAVRGLLGGAVAAGALAMGTGVAVAIGCPGRYWEGHLGSWPPTGYSPSQQLQSVFAQASIFPSLAPTSLQNALAFRSGSGVKGAARTLLRAAVAALLNSAHPVVDYPRTTASVISDVNAALASNDRSTMLNLARQLNQDSNEHCPLN